MKRLPDWHSRLVHGIEEFRRKPFSWEDNDCFVNWAGMAVIAVTGEDVVKPWRERKRYKTARGAVRLMRDMGHESLDELLGSLLVEIHPSQAVIGDLALIPVKSDLFGYSIGIVNGSTVLALGETGLKVTDLLTAEKAYMVGDR